MPESSAFPKASGFTHWEVLVRVKAQLVRTQYTSFQLKMYTAHIAPTVWDRAYLHNSVCIPKTLDACLTASGLSKEDIDVYDFYSSVAPVFAPAARVSA